MKRIQAPTVMDAQPLEFDTHRKPKASKVGSIFPPFAAFFCLHSSYLQRFWENSRMSMVSPGSILVEILGFTPWVIPSPQRFIGLNLGHPIQNRKCWAWAMLFWDRCSRKRASSIVVSTVVSSHYPWLAAYCYSSMFDMFLEDLPSFFRKTFRMGSPETQGNNLMM